MPSIHEQAALMALAATDLEPHRVAWIVEQTGSASAILGGDVDQVDDWHRQDASMLARHADRAAVPSHQRRIEQFRRDGIDLLTVLDREYPFNLRQVRDMLPFLLLQGTLTTADEHSVAIAGDEADTEDWVARAADLARQIARAGANVIAEIGRSTGDAALSAALDTGGRAVGVLDHGIAHMPMRASPALAAGLRRNGAMVSACQPDAPPSETSRAAAQTVTSGLAAALLVVSGPADGSSRRQARRCLEQHRRLMLDERLVLHEPWAKHYSDHPGAVVTQSADDVLEVLAAEARLRPKLVDGDSRDAKRDPFLR